MKKTFRISVRLWRRNAAALLSASLAVLTPHAMAAYPEKPVRIIHAYPGAPLDSAVRYIADKLSAVWHQPVIVETRPGAAEIIAGDAVAKAAPDGYTLFVGSESNFSNNQYLYSKLPFNPERDLVPVTELFALPFALIVPYDFPANTVKEFAAALKMPGADYSYASSGLGSPNHMLMETLLQTLDVKMLHVPYKVGPQITQDLIAGRVQAVVGGVYTAVPYVPTHRLKLLAVSGIERQKAIPDTPTFSEAGYPSIDIQTYVGMAAPKGTPPAIVEKIRNDIKAILMTSEFQQKVGEPLAYVPVGSTPAQFSEFLVSRRANTQKEIKALGLKLD
ncbi:MAG: tripartite tricarboxylate transporter substrate binding protein [Variovorax sp.]|nr:tripartite tricarboxylate transporter substrate binding protein [Variovorax sp.]